MGMITKIENIRKRWSYRMDEKHSALSTRLPFGLCEDVGINTEGMTPREAWDAYYGKTGVKPEDVKEEKFEEEKAEKDDSYSKAEEAKKKYDEIFKEVYGKDNATAEERKEVDKVLKEYIDAVDKWVSGLEDYNVGTIDYENADDDELEKRESQLTDMGKMITKLGSDERVGEVYHSFLEEKEKLKDEYKKRIAEEEKRLMEDDGESADEETIKSMSDEELDSLYDKLVGRSGWYGYELDTTVDKLGARRDAIKELRREADAEWRKVKNEYTRREEKKLQENWKVGDPKPTTPKYDSQMMQDYSSKVKPPEINTGLPTLEGWRNCADDYVNKFVNGKHREPNTLWGLGTDQLVNLQGNLQNIFDNSEFCVNINSATVEKVFGSHLMSQFESGKTDGAKDLGARRNLSHNLFGTSEDLDNREREKYGYIADRDDYECTLGRSGPSYGDTGDGVRCTLTLRKDNLANRTTYTFKDSLAACYDVDHDEYAAGVVDTNCSIEGISYWWSHAKGIADGSIKSIADMYKGSMGFRYCEAQFHGLVTAKDIDAVRFKSISDMRKGIKAWGKDAMDIAKQNGIRFAYYDQLDGKFTYLTAEETEKKVKSLY